MLLTSLMKKYIAIILGLVLILSACSRPDASPEAQELEALNKKREAQISWAGTAK